MKLWRHWITYAWNTVSFLILPFITLSITCNKVQISEQYYNVVISLYWYLCIHDDHIDADNTNAKLNLHS